jgi:ABC-type multidrug transport system fused ATPase/permease subunit
MSFFDTTPLGRILNRFSKDQATVDESLPRSFYSFIRTGFQVLSVIAVITYSSPGFILVVIPLCKYDVII